MGDTVDRSLAAAEARLERLDDARHAAATNGQPDDPVSLDAIDMSDPSLHIEDEEPEPAAGLTTEEILLELEGPDPDLADCIDAFNESFNARDLEGVLELVDEDCEFPGLGNDIDNFPEAIEDLWERRPSCTLTRAEHDRTPLAVMWELGDGEAWWRVATVHFDDAADGHLGVIEFTDDPTLLEEVEAASPDGDLEEGARWTEWEDGSVGEA